LITFVKERDLVTRVVAGETIIVPIRHGVGDLNAIYTLNEVGTRIWQLIDGKTRVEQIVKTITAEYEVLEEEAGKDVVDYLDSLESAGLIKAKDGVTKSRRMSESD
jgi:hypothetical protein